MRISLTAVASLLATVALAQPHQPDARTLLLDHLDETFVPDGKLMTKPEVGKPVDALTGGRPMTGTRFVPGKFGNALEFHGLTKMDYPAGPNLNLAAGLLEFWVALNFDAGEQIKAPGLLSNQMLATFWGPKGSDVCIYSCLNRLCVGVWNQGRQLIAYTAVSGTWKKDEWHHVQLTWGRQLVLQVDEQKSSPVEWFGLFGPVDSRPDDLRLAFGSQIGMSGVHSEFKLDELRILGPGGEQVPDYPVMIVPRLPAPKIDGNIEDAEWADAARTTGFVGLNDNALVEDQTTIVCGWDDTALYVAADCTDPKARPLVAQFRDRDSAVYMEDALDIILQPGPEPYPFYQLVSNAAGTVFDCAIDRRQITKVDTKFNPDWTVATTRAPGRWTLEARIPFAALGRATPKDGERWRVNFCRDADAASRLSSWAYTAGNFHRIENFGEIIFGNSDRAVRLGPLGDWAVGKLNARFALAGPTITPVVTFQATLIGADAKPIIENHERFADYRALDLTPPTLVSGLYNLTLRAQVGDREMYYHRLPFRVMKPYDIRVENYPYEGKLWVIANIAGLPDVKGVTARTRLLQGDKLVGECQTDQFTRGLGPAAIASDALPPGEYVVKSDLVGADGKVLASAEADWEQFAKPSWWRSPAGLDHTIPPPWTPVRVDDEGIKVLGRTYRVGEGSLPTQIINQGQEILAGPITLQATADGKTVDLGRLRALDAAHPDDASVRHARGACG
ncbi:MAG: hypothetical protein KKI08_06200, partial [Armatimonadetes bacterium]|nr:hypothetical protein [Armatimonadota bacterium]